MAVEARHVNLSNQQRNLVNSMNGFVYNRQTMGENFLPIQQIQVQPKTSVSGLTFNHQLPTNDAVTPRKRSRDHYSFNDQFTTPPQISSSFVGDDVFPLFQQDHYLDIISHHTKKIRLELEEQQKREARMLVGAIGERVMNKMKEKDEEIERIGKMNLVLQERVKSLYMENQLWRDLAHTNEATANSLRSNLEQLLAHVSDERLSAVNEEDVESSCSSSSSNEEEEEEEAVRTLAGDALDKSKGMCWRCGERESCVLLLPCRHLCLCTLCASTSHHACPICNSNMNATLHVNMSSQKY